MIVDHLEYRWVREFDIPLGEYLPGLRVGIEEVAFGFIPAGINETRGENQGMLNRAEEIFLQPLGLHVVIEELVGELRLLQRLYASIHRLRIPIGAIGGDIGDEHVEKRTE